MGRNARASALQLLFCQPQKPEHEQSTSQVSAFSPKFSGLMIKVKYGAVIGL
jgi:hypothetical protein